MKKSKLIMTVIVSFCLVILFIPMGKVNANNKDSATSAMGTSIAGAVLTTGVSNISEDVASVSNYGSTTLDETPDTSDHTPIHIVTTIALLSFVVMAVVCVKEYYVSRPRVER